MRFKIIFLFFVLILINVNIVNASVESFAKDGAKQAICKSEKGGAACQAYSALNDPTGQLMNELGPQAMQFFSGIQDPLGTGKGMVMEKIMSTLPPEAQSAVQFYNQFQKYLGKVNDFFGKEEVDKYEADYEDGKAIVKKDGEPYFVVPDSYKIKEETETVTGAIISVFASEEPKITIEVIKKDQKQLQMNGYKINNAKENTEITLLEEDGEKRLLIKNGYGDVEINGKNIKGVKDAEFIIKDNKIEFAEFTSKDGGDYNFEYSNIVYDFKVGKDERVKFNPKKNIEGKAPLNITYLKSGERESYSYNLVGDYNIIMTKDGIPSYIDYGKNGKFCDNLKCDNLEASSKEAFTLCIGEGSFKNICPKKLNSLSYKIDKEGFEIYNSRGLIDYKVKETKINGKKGSETVLASGKEGVVLNLVKHGEGINFKHNKRGFSIDNKGDMSIDVKTFKSEYKTDKNFIVNYQDSNVIMAKSGGCYFLAKEKTIQCVDDDVLNLIGAKEAGTKQKTQQLILDRAIEQNKISAEDFQGKGTKLSTFSSWEDCISHFKNPDTCIEEADKILSYNSALDRVKKQVELGKSYESALETIKKDYPDEYRRIKSSPLHEYLTKGVKNDGSISPTALTSIIPKFEKDAKCTFSEGCDPGARLALASIGADNTLFFLNKPVYDAKGNLISIPNSGIYLQLTPINNALYGKGAMNYKQMESKVYETLSEERLQEIYPGLKYKRKITGPEGKQIEVSKVEFIPPPKTPSEWYEFAKKFEEDHKKAIDSPLTGGVPYTIDTDGNFLFYPDIKEGIDEQTRLFKEIENRNPYVFGLIDDNYKIAKSDESLSIYEFVTPLDVATIVSPVTALKGIRYAKVLTKTPKGVRLSLVSDAFKGLLPLGKVSKTAAVRELIEARNSLKITNDLVKSGLIKCASPCVISRDLTRLLESAFLNPGEIEKRGISNFVATIGDSRTKLKEFVTIKKDTIDWAINNANDLDTLNYIKAVLEDSSEIGLDSITKVRVDKQINMIKEKYKLVLQRKINIITESKILKGPEKLDELDKIIIDAEKTENFIIKENARHARTYVSKTLLKRKTFYDEIDPTIQYKWLDEKTSSVVFQDPTGELIPKKVSNINNLKSSNIKTYIFENNDIPFYATNTVVKPIYPGINSNDIIKEFNKLGIKAKLTKVDIYEVVTLSGNKGNTYLVRRTDLENWELMTSIEKLTK